MNDRTHWTLYEGAHTGKLKDYKYNHVKYVIYEYANYEDYVANHPSPMIIDGSYRVIEDVPLLFSGEEDDQ